MGKLVGDQGTVRVRARVIESVTGEEAMARLELGIMLSLWLQGLWIGLGLASLWIGLGLGGTSRGVLIWSSLHLSHLDPSSGSTICR